MILPNLIRRRSAFAAATLEPLAEALFEDPATGVAITDQAGRIVRTNARLRDMLGGRGAVLPAGRPAETVLAETDQEHARAVLRAALHGITPVVPPRFRLDTGEADQSDVALSLTPLHEHDGQIGGLVLRFTEMNTDKRLAAQFAHSQKLLAVGELAGGIAHDFNNLLTAISGAAESVLDRAAIDGESLNDVRQIHRSADRGAALVRQLLAFGRRQPMAARVVPVNAAIRDLMEMLGRLLGEKMRLELDLEEPGRLVFVDPTQLDQVLINLSVNARDAMPDGGTLTLRTGHRTLYRAEMLGAEAVPPGRYASIEVEDTGVGIPPEILSRVFEPFFTTRRERGGSGLGLSTVHGIVRQSGGFVAVHSQVGEGTRVRVWLPRYQETEAANLAPEPAPRTVVPMPAPATRPSRLLLLVEDEASVRLLAQRALAKAGWNVAAYDSAEAALEHLPRPGDAAEAPAVLVSDVVLPGMDGTKLVREVRQIWPDLPAVLVSGYAESTLRGDLAADGAMFLPKPYRLKELVSWVERAVASGGTDVRE
ncbi:MAG TPA: ATP-binding protein [Acetobacteraceae bacterium]|jgi:two-component system cell cycle sensor histidine kinase/response regulator CckA